MRDAIFVFGSNLAGIHGAGAAKFARQHRGAVWGEGVGHFGRSYALPTKNLNIKTLSMESIRYYVDHFIEYARQNPHLEFQVTRVGCGLAGLTDAQMASLFVNAGSNCYFDTAWEQWLPGKKFWGTF